MLRATAIAAGFALCLVATGVNAQAAGASPPARDPARPASAAPRPKAPAPAPARSKSKAPAPAPAKAAPAKAAPAKAAPPAAPRPDAAAAGPQTGLIAYYGEKFAGRPTASGEPFDPEAMTMSHRTLPFGTRVRVTNLSNDLSVIVRVTDRLPTGSKRIADLSRAAAERIDMIGPGVVEARLEVMRVMTSR